MNLRPLTALAQLKELNLGSNKIVGLDGLEAMKALRTLHLTGNQIADLQPLFKLVGLRELELVQWPVALSRGGPVAGGVAAHADQPQRHANEDPVYQ